MRGQLYPFLSGKDNDPAAVKQSLLDSIHQKCADSVCEKQRFFEENAHSLIDVATAISRSFRDGGRLFTMGNGGSSCDAAHLAVEFQHPVTAGRPALPAQNLTMDTAMLSAVGNDVGMDQVYARQIEALAGSRDVLAGFSTSGNSKNLLTGFRTARTLGLTTVGFAGGDGGEMSHCGLLDHCLVVRSGSIHRIQEVHVTIYHILWDLVHTQLAASRGKLGQQSSQS